MPFVFHDENALRLTGEDVQVVDLTWKDLQDLKIPAKIDRGDGKIIDYGREAKISSLEEVLVALGGQLALNVEIKAYGMVPARRSWGREVAKVIRNTGSFESVIVTSFDPLMLLTLEKEYPELHSGFDYPDELLGEKSPLKTKVINWLMEKILSKFFRLFAKFEVRINYL